MTSKLKIVVFSAGEWTFDRDRIVTVVQLRKERVIDAFARIEGPDASPDLRHRRVGRAGEVRRSVLDASRAASALGWQPAYDLGLGLVETMAWIVRRDAADVR